MNALAARLRGFAVHLPAVRRWSGRGFWAVTDQALFAGTNFIVSILLARWLLPEAYGAFATAFAVFLLVGTLHTALWTEPMLVYGSDRYRASGRAYQRLLIADHWRFAVLVVLLFLGLAGVFHALAQPALARSFLGLAVAAPLVLYLWLVRRAAYVILQPRLAAQAGLLYLLLYLGMALALRRLALLDETTALASMGIAAWLAGVLVARAVQGAAENEACPSTLGELRSVHWSYGRWALVAGMLSWVPLYFFYLLLPAVHGLESAATLRAVMNLAMPVLHFNTAIAGLFVPLLIRSAHKSFAHLSIPLFAAQLTPALIFAILVWYYGVQLTDWLYDGKFASERHWFVAMGIIALAGGCGNVLVAHLRARERPYFIAKADLIISIFTVSFGSVVAIYFGITGIFFSLAAVNLIYLACLWRSVKICED